MYMLLTILKLSFAICSVMIFEFTAFDMVKDPYTSLEIIIKLGFERILTSGQDSSALEGLPTIKYLIEKVKMHFPFHGRSSQIKLKSLQFSQLLKGVSRKLGKFRQ